MFEIVQLYDRWISEFTETMELLHFNIPSLWTLSTIVFAGPLSYIVSSKSVIFNMQGYAHGC